MPDSFDLRSAAVAAIDNMISNGKITAMIDATLEKCMASIIEDCMRSYSDFGKQLSEAVKKAMCMGDHIELPNYNHAITEFVKRKLHAAQETSIHREIEKQVGKLLTPAPETISIKQLIETFRKQIEKERESNDDYCGCDDPKDTEIGFEAVESENINGWRDIYISEEAHKFDGGTYLNNYKKTKVQKTKYQHDYHLRVNDKGELWRIDFKDDRIEGRMFTNDHSDFELLLFQMRMSGTKITFDDLDKVDTYVSNGRDI